MGFLSIDQQSKTTPALGKIAASLSAEPDKTDVLSRSGGWQGLTERTDPC